MILKEINGIKARSHGSETGIIRFPEENHRTGVRNLCSETNHNGFQEESGQGIYSIISSKINTEFEKSRSLHKSDPHFGNVREFKLRGRSLV
jgi:hypothetical protein